MVQEATPAPAVDSERSLERKRDILRAAAAVFRRKGFHAAGMRDIAAQAGMHAGNLYYYFANKQELLAFCQQDSLDQLTVMAREVVGSSESPDTQLRRLITEHVRILNEDIPGSLAHLEVEALESPWRAVIQARRDEYESLLRDIIAAGAAQGVFRDVDAKLAALAVLGAVNWTVKWYQPDGSLPARTIGETFAATLVDGLCGPRDRP